MATVISATAQPEPGFPPPDGAEFEGPPPAAFRMGGPGPQPELEVSALFDKDKDGFLNSDERKAAREHVVKERAGRGMRPGGPPRFGREENQTPPQPGQRISPVDVRDDGNKSLYETSVVRTLFLEFENADWEKELADFHNTDVEVPAKLIANGKTYADVGVHFRGASSFMMVGEGRKRSLNLSLDYRHKGQTLAGYQTLELLNAHEDPTFLRTVLYSHIARQYIPAPKANFVRVVINGENWGIYINSQQFNRDLIQDFFGTTKGARWKVPGSPMGRGGLAYLGDDPVAYKSTYKIKSKDKPESWAALIRLCKVLNETPVSELRAALEPVLNVDGALRFLALENALINNDGFWTRASDYSLYLDEGGRFHILPHDFNETFALPGGPGFGPPGGRPRMAVERENRPGAGGTNMPPFRGPTRGTVELDPLVSANDSSKALISRLLAVPEFRARYLKYVKEIADTWLDWNRLGPVAKRYQDLIRDEVQKDTRKLYSMEAFLAGMDGVQPVVSGMGRPGSGISISLKQFADQRRAYLLKYEENASAKPVTSSVP